MDIFSALADQNRREIVELLAKNGQLAASQIYDKFSVSAPAISQHLKVLKDADLVLVEKKAQQRIYKLNPQKVEELDRWVDKLKLAWEERFDRLEKVLIVGKAK